MSPVGVPLDRSQSWTQIQYCWNACYAAGITYNFPREVMFFSFNVNWSTKWNTTNSSTLEPSKLIRLPFIPCLQLLSNVYITCTTYTQVPVTDSKTWLLLKKGTQCCRPAFRMMMSPSQELALTKWTVCFLTFPTYGKENDNKTRTGKEISTRHLQKSMWCLMYYSQFWCRVAPEWLNEKTLFQHTL